MLVAVYGTLKEGNGNHHLMSDSILVAKERLRGFVMYSNGGFPVVYFSDNPDSEIVVEVYEVPDISSLDALEGHPDWYRRQQVQTSAGLAWIYIMQSDEYKSRWNLIESGEF